MAERALATAFVNIVPGTKDLESYLKGKLQDDVESAGDPAGRKLGESTSKGFTKNFAIGGAVAGIFASITNSIMGQMEDLGRQALSASDATDKFKKTLDFAGVDSKTIDSLTASTQKYADQTVYSIADIQGITAQLAANGVKDYDKLAEAAGNLNSVSGGSAQTFKSVGMVLTQTAGQGKLTAENWNQLADAIPGASGVIQKALEKNAAFTGNFRDAMSEGQITSEEFNQALLELGSDPVAVEAARSTDTFEGALGNLEATITGKLAQALNSMKPQLTGAINGISEFASSIPERLSAIGKWVDENKVWLGILAGTILTVMLPAIVVWVTSTVAGWATSTAAAVAGAASQLVQSYKVIGSWVIMGAQAIAGAARVVAGWVMTGISAIGAGLIMAATVAGFVAGWVMMGIQSLIGAAKVAAAWFIALGPIGWVIAAVIGLVAIIVANWDAIAKFTTEIWSGIVTWFTDMWNGFTQWFSDAVTNVVNFVSDYWGLLLSFFIGPLGLAIQWIVENWSGIVSFFQTTMDQIGGFFQSVFSGIGDFINGVFQGVVGYIKSYVNTIIDIINGIIGGVNAVAGAIKTATGGAVNVKIGKIPRLAKGGFVDQPTTALIGEAGPEVVTPLKDFERMMGLNGNGAGQTIIYNAAPNDSISAEQKLVDAVKRAQVLAWT